MKNLLFLLLLGGALFLAILFFWQYKTTRSELGLQTQRVTDRDSRIYKQDKLVDSLQKRLANIEAPTETSDEDTIELMTPPSAKFMDELGSLSESDIKRLEKKGLRNPEVDLKNDLMKKPNLIAVKASAGGSMSFRDIRILNDTYALAYFEDGHNGGNMLLKYTVTNGSISWKVLDTTTL
jgi:hypothetical protein